MRINVKSKNDIEALIGKMSIEEKVGQTLVIGFVGTVLTPKILERVKSISPAGIRVCTTLRMKDAAADPYAYNQDRLDRVVRKPVDSVKDFSSGYNPPSATNEEYCRMLNLMKEAALDSGAGIPIHITLDMEGDGSADYQIGRARYFPSCMGIAQSGEPSLAYKVGQAVAKQVAPIGFNWIHSPVADVNTNPKNPEIGVRSFGETADSAIPSLLESYKGLRDGGLICTGKHFPGRGPSVSDAHSTLPLIDISSDAMEEHLKTFQALVDAGCPSIMTAHTAYPSLDPSGLPATLSKPILTGLLKNQMGFKRVITTDDITMGGIVEKFDVHEACIMAINAGADLILFRDESSLIDEVYPKMVDAVKNGLISEERLNDAVYRTLSVKLEYGILAGGGRDESICGDYINSAEVKQIAAEAADKTTRILRDRAHILPVAKDKKVLLLEQIHPLHEKTNTVECHPSLLWEMMLEKNPKISSVECTLAYNNSDRARIENRIGGYDVIIATNYYFRRDKNCGDYIKNLAKTCGKPLIVVSNCPYDFTLSDDMDTVVMCYGGSIECMQAVAKLVLGE